MCIIFDTYFQWNENAGRMMRCLRDVPVFMPETEWRDNGVMTRALLFVSSRRMQLTFPLAPQVPMHQVKTFNRHVADLCRANFSPWCAICKGAIAPDCIGSIAILPSKRLCPICKTDAFISDYRLWCQYNISMKHVVGPAAMAAVSAVESELQDHHASDRDNDDDDVKKKRRAAPRCLGFSVLLNVMARG
jgi:hypothetical protein